MRSKLNMVLMFQMHNKRFRSLHSTLTTSLRGEHDTTAGKSALFPLLSKRTAISHAFALSGVLLGG